FTTAKSDNPNPFVCKILIGYLVQDALEPGGGICASNVRGSQVGGSQQFGRLNHNLTGAWLNV
ncbi:MAG: hypothetical protein ABR554_11965, partial [Pyrinomonadaceae bacterium]